MESPTVTRYIVEQDRHDKTQKPGHCSRNQSARANQPSKLCDYQATAEGLEHLCPGTTTHPPPTPQLNMTETDIYEEVYISFLS